MPKKNDKKSSKEAFLAQYREWIEYHEATISEINAGAYTLSDGDITAVKAAHEEALKQHLILYEIYERTLGER